jgi:hypothetical protein
MAGDPGFWDVAWNPSICDGRSSSLNAQIEKLKKHKAQLPRELQSIVDRLATLSATASNQVSKLSEAQEAVAAAVSKHRDDSHEGRAGH